ncbi:MAG: hypothetical protein WBC91_22115 [Phototrophicaceae bacterium]
MQTRLLTLITILMIVLVACESNDQASDSLSAQNQQPALVGYETTDLDMAADAILGSAAGTALVGGNVPLSLAIQRADALLQCLQDTGSVSALSYFEGEPSFIPQMGASFVVNKTRAERNLFSCITELGFSAQSALDIEPCASYGEFTVQNDEFWFAYVGIGSGVCAGFSSHYASLNATILGQYLAPVE